MRQGMNTKQLLKNICDATQLLPDIVLVILEYVVKLAYDLKQEPVAVLKLPLRCEMIRFHRNHWYIMMCGRVCVYSDEALLKNQETFQEPMKCFMAPKLCTLVGFSPFRKGVCFILNSHHETISGAIFFAYTSGTVNEYSLGGKDLGGVGNGRAKRNYTGDDESELSNIYKLPGINESYIVPCAVRKTLLFYECASIGGIQVDVFNILSRQTLYSFQISESSFLNDLTISDGRLYCSLSCNKILIYKLKDFTVKPTCIIYDVSSCFYDAPIAVTGSSLDFYIFLCVAHRNNQTHIWIIKESQNGFSRKRVTLHGLENRVSSVAFSFNRVIFCERHSGRLLVY